LSLAEIPIADRNNPQAYVDNFARSLAMSMLNCIFGNEQQIDNSPCSPGLIKIQDGVVEENSIQSLISQEDANAQALALATSLKICINTNLIGGGNNENPYDEYVHPFKVLTNFSNGRVGVYYHSNLYKSLAPDHKQTITGLLTTHPPSNSDSGWFTPSSNDLIWLEVDFDNTYDVTAARINSLSKGGNFDISAHPFESPNACLTENKARKLIAKINNGKINQFMFTHQLIRAACVDGRIAIYPFNH
jgi:hypothetical protein